MFEESRECRQAVAARGKVVGSEIREKGGTTFQRTSGALGGKRGV